MSERLTDRLNDNFPLQVQVPNPLPLSWGRTVKPYKPAAARQQPTTTSTDTENIDSSNGQQASTSYQEDEDLLDADFKKFTQPFQAVLISPGHLISLALKPLICLCVCLCVCWCLLICLHGYLAVCLTVMPACLLVRHSACLSGWLAGWLSVCLFNCMLVYLSVCLSVCLSV